MINRIVVTLRPDAIGRDHPPQYVDLGESLPEQTVFAFAIFLFYSIISMIYIFSRHALHLARTLKGKERHQSPMEGNMQLISRSWTLSREIAGFLISAFERRTALAPLAVAKANLCMKVVVLAFAFSGFQLCDAMLGSTHAQQPNGVVQLRDEQTIIIEGPFLGGQAKRFAQIAAHLYRSEKREFTIYINSEGGSFDEANRIIGAMLAFQRRGGQINTIVPRRSICWSFCPMIFSFGDRRFADDETSWMFHRPVPDRDTEEIFTEPAIERAINGINEFWLVRLRAIDPKFADSIIGNWLQDGAEHKVSGSALRELSRFFFDRNSEEAHPQLGRSTPLTRPDGRH